MGLPVSKFRKEHTEVRKDQIASGHIEQMKKDYSHAVKPRPWDSRRALVTGAENPGSIGDAIVDMLTGIYAGVQSPPKKSLDVTDAEKVCDYFNGVLSPTFDSLICCHGVNKMAWFEDFTSEEMDEIIKVNLLGSMYMACAFVNVTKELPWRKQIVFIGSMAYNHVLNASAPYCASKAGLAMLTRCLAWELAPKGFDVYCVHPSNTEGAPMTEATIKGIMEYRNLTRREAEAYWGAVLPRERWLQPNDIAGIVRTLLTEESGYLSGSNLELAGGQR